MNILTKCKLIVKEKKSSDGTSKQQVKGQRPETGLLSGREAEGQLEGSGGKSIIHLIQRRVTSAPPGEGSCISTLLGVHEGSNILHLRELFILYVSRKSSFRLGLSMAVFTTPQAGLL